jgi:predicted AlkP superfamily pyrophosphatase or phosphodiesterase
MLTRLRPYLSAFLLCSVFSLAQTPQPTPVITVDNGPNALVQEQKHYVVLVSLDGFRYDYAKKYGATHLLALAKQGASAPDGMIPSYPSLTFPNHYTLVTGLYPEHHGIVANSFYDEQRKERYSYTDAKTNSDGTWYGGTPLWVLAEQQGMRSACFFWPGSEAAIQNVRPSYYLHFDNKFPDEQRIDQVIAWLKLPEDKRPHLITLYYSNVDHAGHEYGPGSPQVAEAVKQVDVLIGKLHASLDALHMPIDLIVLSDHGMAKEEGTWIDLDQYTDLSNFTTVGRCGEGIPETQSRRQQVRCLSTRSNALMAALQQQPARRRPHHRPQRPLLDSCTWLGHRRAGPRSHHGRPRLRSPRDA